MKLITLRNIPPEVAEAIKMHSKATGLSLNKTVIRILEKAVGAPGSAKPARRHSDLDEFIGIWSNEDAREFDAILSEQRRIDPEMWE